LELTIEGDQGGFVGRQVVNGDVGVRLVEPDSRPVLLEAVDRDHVAADRPVAPEVEADFKLVPGVVGELVYGGFSVVVEEHLDRDQKFLSWGHEGRLLFLRGRGGVRTEYLFSYHWYSFVILNKTLWIQKPLNLIVRSFGNLYKTGTLEHRDAELSQQFWCFCQYSWRLWVAVVA